MSAPARLVTGIPPAAASSSPPPASTELASTEPAIRKRDGRPVPFDPVRIEVAIAKAFRAEHGDAAAAEPLAGRVVALAGEVVAWCRRQVRGELSVEAVQDQVERVLMLAGEHRIARRYVLYREARAGRRRGTEILVAYPDGTERPLCRETLAARLGRACGDRVPAGAVAELTAAVAADLPSRVTADDLAQAAILAARTRIEFRPAFTFVAARLLLERLDVEVLGEAPAAGRTDDERADACRAAFPEFIRDGIAGGLLDPRMEDFDLETLATALRPERDFDLAYLGLQTLYDRYVLRLHGRRRETPQFFFLRVAMGLCLQEDRPTRRAIEFYELSSSFRFMSATPTLFNAGTRHPQLSSCYLTTVDDDLFHIFECIRDNALLSKWAGGLGNDWTNIRALGAEIRGTGGKSQGVVPFLKVVSDAAVAVNQGGKRKGAVCAYLETWHLDLEEFLELRRNTGDERRRTPDLHTAHWIPDLFMKRVLENGEWTLFSPDEVPDLHHVYGREFERRYVAYERAADAGRIRLFRRLGAVGLWRKMLSMLFETGHPWLTWKDPSNVRSPQDHVGVVHNSNLCTEILLNNSAEETAVCNLGSVNLAAHVTAAGLDFDRLGATIRTAVRMLDNVIDLNYYPTPEARTANLRHRPIGLGLMGFQDALHRQGIAYAAPAAAEFADRSMEAIAWHAYAASAELAAERGRYSTYAGSKWDRGLFPQDTVALLAAERGLPIEVDTGGVLDWTAVRQAVATHGLRNGNVLAIAPTATISNIVGVTQSIEPTYRNLYVKSNLSGEFTQVDAALVADLERLGLWTPEFLDRLKYHDGEIESFPEVPDDLKVRYRTAFSVEPGQLIECAARRQKWIDMGQSLNLYLADPSGRKLDAMYFLAWRKGLKTTYYLRTLAATQVEKSTVDVNRYGIQPRWMKHRSESDAIRVDRADACGLDGTCEACQ